MPLLLDGLRTQFAASDPNEVFADVTGAKPGEFRYVTGDGVVFSAIDSTNGHSYYQTLKASLDSLGATSKLTLLLSSSGGGQHTFASADYYTRGLWLAYDLDGPFTAYESSSSFKIGGFSALRAGSLVQGNVLPPGQTVVCTLITRDLTSSILTAAPDRTTGHRTTFTGSGAIDYVFPVNPGEWGLNADSELAIFRTIDGTVDACVNQIPQNSYIYFFHEDADNHNYAVYKANPRANTVLVVDVYYVSTVTEIYNSLTPGDSTRMLILPSQVNNLDELTDVVAPNPSPGQSLVYDGANWINQTPSSGSDFFAHTFTYNSTQAPPTITDVGQWRYDETLDRFYLSGDISDGLFSMLDIQNVHVIKVYNKVDSTMYGYYRVSLTDSKSFVDLGGGVGYIVLNGVEEMGNTSIPDGRECQLIFDFMPNMILNNIVGVAITGETDGQVLTYDSGSGNWVNGAGGAGETITASNEGAGVGTPFIQRTADNLEFKTISGSNGVTVTNNAETIDIAGTRLLNDLEDVTINTPLENQFLVFDGTGWKNKIRTLFQAGFAPTNTHDSTIGYEPGSRWTDITNRRDYVCVDATPTLAVWRETSKRELHDLENTTISGGGDPADSYKYLKWDDTSNKWIDDYVSASTSASALTGEGKIWKDTTEQKLRFNTATALEGIVSHGFVNNAEYTTLNETFNPTTRFTPESIAGATGAVTWPASVGVGSLGIQGANTQYADNTIGGKRAIIINSATTTDASYRIALDLGQDYNFNAGFTLAFVVQDIARIDNTYIFTMLDNTPLSGEPISNTNQASLMYVVGGGALGYAFGIALTNYFLAGTALPSGPIAIIYRYGGTGNIRGTIGTTTDALFLNLGTSMVGAFRNIGIGGNVAGATRCGRVKVSEVLFWDSQLSDVQTTALAQALTSGYGVRIGSVFPSDANLSIGQLNNVTINGPEHGQVLCYDKDTATFRNDTVVWNDLMGLIDFRTGGGANAPTVSAFRDTQVAYACQSGPSALTDFYLQFHTNHDNLTGSEWHLHVHHASNAAAETGQVKFVATVSYAAINGVFTADTTLVPFLHTYDGTQYKHVVTEIPMGVSGGGVNLVNTDLIPTDSMVLVRIRRDNADVADTVVTNASVFVFQVDIHYTSSSKVGSYTRGPPFD